MTFINQIICGNNVDVMRQFPDDCIDLTVTSPPYDNLRTYNGYSWDFEAVANELYRVTKPGGVVVWVVGDTTNDFCESLSSFQQAIAFVKKHNFKLLDTMIFEKCNRPPQYPSCKRYTDHFEYMFVLSKGKPKTFNPIKIANRTKQSHNSQRTYRQRDGSLRPICNPNAGDGTKQLTNVWQYVSAPSKKTQHPAIFPEQLAHDHIVSWSNPGDIVLDPFVGSGTTCKMALLAGRKYIGIDISKEYCDIAQQRVGAYNG